MGLFISVPMCLAVLQHTKINVHGCPATVTLHWSIGFSTSQLSNELLDHPMCLNDGGSYQSDVV